MGWKNVKEHYRIDHQVEVTEEGICIGSPYAHAIIVISLDGALIKEADRTLNKKLMRYQVEMKADPAKLRELVVSPDTFCASIPVYTYRGAEIIEKRCEELGWPNVTHDGDMMYENTFFANREDAVAAAKNNCESSILLRRMEISDLRHRMAKSNSRLEELLDNASRLGLPLLSDPAPETNLAGKEPPLDWSNFEGPKRNVEWKPDDQDLIYTAINYRDDEYGDQDEDAGQQIVERLLSAWKSAATSEQITFEIAARLLKERDAAEAARAKEWRLRRDAEASRDAAKAAAASLRMELDEVSQAPSPQANLEGSD